MENLATKYFTDLKGVFKDISATNLLGESLEFFSAIGNSAGQILATGNTGGKIMFIGNGANAGIASHIAADLSKNTAIPAMAFNDPVMLTAAANDCGVEEMFSVPIRVFAKKNDVLVALSSSGNSKNIIHGIKSAKKIGCTIITITGFKPDNPIRTMGDTNFYTTGDSYALTEVVHHAICHSLVNCIIEKKKETNE